MSISGRGGKRENAGRKSAWPSGCAFKDTKLIRVPTYLAGRLMEIARSLDSGEDVDLVTYSKTKENTEITSVKDEKTNNNFKELVTKSKPEPIQCTLDLVTESKAITKEELPIVPGKMLAKRLGVTQSKLSTKKKEFMGSKTLFYDWIQSVDPDNIRWISMGSSNYSKGYKPSSEVAIELVTKLNRWIEDNTK